MLDISGSMSKLYKGGTVQNLLDRITAVAGHFDDDGLLDLKCCIYHVILYSYAACITVSGILLIFTSMVTVLRNACLLWFHSDFTYDKARK
ncbi:hypothetical protein DOT_1982 [Desulfosporosinus sp. OT]|nr:hypothetical protein DOT_1982 [Desulfosporosinus sp. OT]